MSSYRNRKKLNLEKQTEYYKASLWVCVLIPNLWNEIKSPETLQNAGITAQLMNEHQQQFWNYYLNCVSIRKNHADGMNDGLKHIIDTIESIIQQNHQKEKTKGRKDKSQEIKQHQQQQQQLYQQQQGYQQPGYHQQNYPNYDPNYGLSMYNQQFAYSQQQGYRNFNYNNQRYQNYGNQGWTEAYSQQIDNYGQKSQYHNYSHQPTQHTQHKQYVKKTQVEPSKQAKIQIQEPRTQPEPIPQSVPEPPKPQRKKFSIQQIIKMIDEAQEETIRTKANPQLIAEIHQMQKWERRTQQIEVTAGRKGNKTDQHYSHNEDSKAKAVQKVPKTIADENRSVPNTINNSRQSIRISTEKINRDHDFKQISIEAIKYCFDILQIKFPEFANDLEKDDFLGRLKKEMIQSVSIIAELIKSKVLSKKIIKSVLQNLISNFLTDYYTFVQKGTPESSIYYFHFEVMIEFLKNLGEKFEEITDVHDRKKKSHFVDVREMILEIAKGQTDPSTSSLYLINELTADEFYRIFEVISISFLSKKQERVWTLLHKLIQRRESARKKHQFQPDKLKKRKYRAKDERAKLQQQTQNKDILTFMKPKPKLSHLL